MADLLDPKVTLVMNSQPAHNNFDRFLSFENHSGKRKRFKIAFRKRSDLIWESDSFPDGIAVLKSLVDTNNRNYWDRIFLENRGGSTTLPIKHIKIMIRYDNPSGSSPHGSNHVINGLDLSSINHAQIPIIDWEINMTLLSGYDKMDLSEFRKRSLHKWAGLTSDDPPFVRRAIEDIGKSGSDGSDKYGNNPKYGGAVSDLCSEFVSWYY